LCEFVVVINMIIWTWFPLSSPAWSFNPNPAVEKIIGFAIDAPHSAILMRGMKDAGKETVQPSKTTRKFGGIYQHVRHPEMLGEMALFIAVALFTNSFFVVLWATLLVALGIPVLVYYQEKDLVKRFADAYLDYQRQTGALIPKFRSK
jgi:protein-S-isoprenylcysteine O-methyltransferase Ste14